MEDYSFKPISEIISGDKIISLDIETMKTSITTVLKLENHVGEFYINKITAISSEIFSASANEITTHEWILEATPNHPIMTSNGKVSAGNIQEGDEIFVTDSKTGITVKAKVASNCFENSIEKTVYNLKTDTGNYFVNGALVLMK
jgi:hypothetical protein